MKSENYVGRLKTSLFWWLGSRRPFFINDEYKIELLYIDRTHNSAKIRITNLKNQQEQEGEVFHDEDLA
jgi:hypothetical protein